MSAGHDEQREAVVARRAPVPDQLPVDPIAEPAVLGRAIRTPKAAAVAGILFSVIFSVALILLRTTVPADPADAGEWLTDGSRRDVVLTALGLVPVAGIVFLWEVGVLRDHVGVAEDRLLATVFLGSAVLFVGMMFVASAVAAGLIVAAEDHADQLVSSGAWEFVRQTVYQLMIEYGMRMAGVFTLITTMILFRARLAPRWLLVFGFAAAFALMVLVSFLAWAELVFPVWMLALSLFVLVNNLRRRTKASPTPT
jgi:hypothetical protein